MRHPELRDMARFQRTGQWIGGAFFAILALIFVLVAVLLRGREGNGAFVGLLAFAAFPGLASVAIVRQRPAWLERADWVLAHGTARAMTMRLRGARSSDGLELFADLRAPAGGAGEPLIERWDLIPPRWDWRALEGDGIPVTLHACRQTDPEGPIVIETARGLLVSAIGGPVRFGA